ncbi:hypothetical protein Leryth_013394 [Lithospermum erythrorhizon]|uniref:Phytocyanin domain-containing protein n=1 Tax=Lithospermum erythrorhizon TaxID=34254 RepID=A0AAV3PU15_LITER|nr:hypothetical protein Leryth_013394 [Lithospermum erythrorhizon]
MASKSAFFPYVALVLIFLISFSEAREFWLKGHHNTWKIPSVPDEFTKWAQKLRFQIGDAIVVDYDPKLDSILEVNEEDYKKCNKSNPIKRFEDGNSTIILNHSGWFYFISGVDGHCEKGQTLALDVLSAKHSLHSPPMAPSSSPTNSHPNIDAPTPSPSNPNYDVPAPAPAPSSNAHSLKTTTIFVGSFTFLLSSLFD